MVHVPVTSWHLIMCFVTVCLNLLWYCWRNILQSLPLFLLHFSSSIPSRNKIMLKKSKCDEKNNHKHSMKWIHTYMCNSCGLLYNYLNKVCIKSTEVCLYTLLIRFSWYAKIRSLCGNYMLLFFVPAPAVRGSLLTIARNIQNVHYCLFNDNTVKSQ